MRKRSLLQRRPVLTISVSVFIALLAFGAVAVAYQSHAEQVRQREMEQRAAEIAEQMRQAEIEARIKQLNTEIDAFIESESR